MNAPVALTVIALLHALAACTAAAPSSATAAAIEAAERPTPPSESSIAVPPATATRPPKKGTVAVVAETAGFGVELQRQGCFGRCPSYRVSVSGDGTVRFVGERDVASIGEHQGQVSPATVAALRTELQREPFAVLKGDYTPGDPRCGPAATDMASVSIAIQDGALSREIRHYLGCSRAPASLRALAAAIDTASGSARWIDAPTE